MALYFGPLPLEHALVWHQTGAPPSSRLAQIGRTYGRSAILAHLGRSQEALAAVDQAERLLAELPSAIGCAYAGFGGGMCFQQLGDLPAAERIMRRGVDALRSISETSYLSSLAPELGMVLFQLGDVAQARAMADLGQKISPPRDRYSQASWRALLARVEAVEGDLAMATGLADEAVEWIEQTDQVLSIAEMRTARAEVHKAAGRLEEARADLHVALETYERKGSRTGARRTQASLAALPAPSPDPGPWQPEPR